MMRPLVEDQHREFEYLKIVSNIWMTQKEKSFSPLSLDNFIYTGKMFD
jgi:hypothetical protein